MSTTFKRRIRVRGIYGQWFDRVEIAHGPSGSYTLLDPKHSQRLYNHSPDGFGWGYGGSGPSQLALAILLEATNDADYAVQNHQEFKRRVIAHQPQRGDFEIIVELPSMAWKEVPQP